MAPNQTGGLVPGALPGLNPPISVLDDSASRLPGSLPGADLTATSVELPSIENIASAGRAPVEFIKDTALTGSADKASAQPRNDLDLARVAGVQGTVVFDGRAAVFAPDQALTGHAGEEILGRLRQAAATGLANKAAEQGGRVSAEEVLARSQEWEQRVWDWIYGLQGLNPVGAKLWLMEQMRGEEGAASLDIETFLPELDKLNRRLESDSLPPMDINRIHILIETENDRQDMLRRLNQPNLAHVGAFLAQGRTLIYEGLAAILTPRQLAAVALHEYLHMRGLEHREVIPIMQRLTGKAFGEPVMDVDLQALVRRVQQSKPKPKSEVLAASPARRVEASAVKNAAQESPSSISFTEGLIIAAVLCLLGALYCLLQCRIDGHPPMDQILSVVMVIVLSLGVAAGANAGRNFFSWLRSRSVAPAQAFEIRGVGEGTQEGWDISFMFFQDQRGTQFGLFLKKSKDRERVELQWGRHELNDKHGGHLFVLTRRDKEELPASGLDSSIMMADEFRRQFLVPLEEALKNYPENSPLGRSEARKLLRRIKETLGAKEEGDLPTS